MHSRKTFVNKRKKISEIYFHTIIAFFCNHSQKKNLKSYFFFFFVNIRSLPNFLPDYKIKNKILLVKDIVKKNNGNYLPIILQAS